MINDKAKEFLGNAISSDDDRSRNVGICLHYTKETQSEVISRPAKHNKGAGGRTDMTLSWRESIPL